MPDSSSTAGQRLTRGIALANTAILVLLACGLFLAPAWTLLRAMRDPALSNGRIPAVAWSLHASLAPEFERWAVRRVASGRAATLGINEIAATEWPVFSSAFFLWGTEALEMEWRAQSKPQGEAPSRSARGAIEAATALIIDPKHAHWVRLHWGDAYLERENLFYRMLVIGGLTSYQRLTGDRKHEPMLRQQATSLAAELDASPHGLLDDYPRQCFPTDIIAAVGVIRRAGEVLGVDFSAVVERAKRGFVGAERIDPTSGLPTFMADARTGRRTDVARGCGLSFALAWAAECWPELAADWYARYEKHFWVEGTWVSGFREWPREISQPEWQMEVDAGPVVAGFGTAASAFGIGAARVFGRPEHAYPLILEALAAGWSVGGGSFFGARAVSSLSDAPYTGEAALLFALTRTAVPAVAAAQSEARLRVPRIVWFALGVFGAGGVGLLAGARRRWLAWKMRDFAPPPSWRGQAIAWAVFCLGGLLVVNAASVLVGGAMLLLAQLLPRQR